MTKYLKGMGSMRIAEEPIVPIEDYKTSKDLAVAVFQKCDVAAIAVDLLKNVPGKSNAVRARTWEKLVELYYGKPAATSQKEEETEYRVVWDIPPASAIEPQ